VEKPIVVRPLYRWSLQRPLIEDNWCRGRSHVIHVLWWAWLM